MLNRYDVLQRLLYLVPGAKCAVWDNDPKHAILDNAQIVGDFRIAWYAENVQPLPTWEEIVGIPNKDLADHIEIKRKEFRDDEFKQDLSVVAAFEIEKKANTALAFSDYLDGLEVAQAKL